MKHLIVILALVVTGCASNLYKDQVDKDCDMIYETAEALMLARQSGMSKETMLEVTYSIDETHFLDRIAIDTFNYRIQRLRSEQHRVIAEFTHRYVIDCYNLYAPTF